MILSNSNFVLLRKGIFLFIFVVFFAIYIAFRSYTNIIEFDCYSTTSLRNQIRDYIANEQNRDSSKLFSTLKNNFKSIENISIRYFPDAQAQIIINLAQPIALINVDDQELILTRSAQLIDVQNYNQNYLSNLSKIKCKKIPDSQIEKEQLLNFILNINKSIFLKYKIYWHNFNQIELTNQSEITTKINNLKIIGHINSLKQIDRIKFVEKIYLQKKNRSISADIRFKDYVIIRDE